MTAELANYRNDIYQATRYSMLPWWVWNNVITVWAALLFCFKTAFLLWLWQCSWLGDSMRSLWAS